MTENGNSDRYNQVLDAALRTFAAHGYERTSVNDIAEAAGLKKPSLYHYMDSKEDLLENIIVRSHTRLTNELKALPPVNSALEMVRQIIYTHVLYNANFGQEAAVFQADFRMLSANRQETIRGMLSEYDRSLQALVEEAQRRGEVPNDINAPLAVNWMLGAANHIVRWYHPRPGSDPEYLANHFADLTISGLRSFASQEASSDRHDTLA
nr:TetR/AcrR family transcriptional regulator [Rhodococcus wratislaviensis]GLK33170.1 TetR family transcriptional regulator [Rhodococcus wratislaviensis]